MPGFCTLVQFDIAKDDQNLNKIHFLAMEVPKQDLITQRVVIPEPQQGIIRCLPKKIKKISSVGDCRLWHFGYNTNWSALAVTTLSSLQYLFH